MVMVPVPESQMLMAIPTSTLSKFESPAVETATREARQQARDLLTWNGNIGRLDGCDLRYRIDQFGFLEVVDSDEETENHTNQPTLNKPTTKHAAISSSTKKLNRNTSDSNSTAANKKIPNEVASRNTSSSSTTQSNSKRAKSDTEGTRMRQISPGSSLLKDGPQIKRPRAVSSGNTLGKQTGTQNVLPGSQQHQQQQQATRKLEIQQIGNSILMEQLVPKQKLNELKTANSIEQWTTEDVKNFINSIPGCSHVGELFVTQQICGKALLYLDQKDLIEVIGVKLGPAVKINHAISLLK